MSTIIQTWLNFGVLIGLAACGSSGTPAGGGGGTTPNGSGNDTPTEPSDAGSTGFNAPPSTTGTTPAMTSTPTQGMVPGSDNDASSGSPPATGTDASDNPEGGEGGTPPPSTSGLCFPAVTDFTAEGTFTPTSGDVTSAACTIFRPTVLGAGGCLNPVIVWGNGTVNTPSSYTALFNHLASHGFIVAAADTSNSGSGKEMLACLQYMLDQNKASGSPYAGHIDVNHIASSGYSQGGAGCLEAGIDPRFTVTAAVSPFIEISLGGYDASSVMKQIHPMFMISGSADTVAVPSANQQPIFMQAPVPIFWATHAGSTHFEVLNNGGAYAGPLTAWFRYKLMGDPAAEQWFEKPPCTLCSASGWSVQTNSMWK